MFKRDIKRVKALKAKIVEHVQSKESTKKHYKDIANDAIKALRIFDDRLTELIPAIYGTINPPHIFPDMSVVQMTGTVRYDNDQQRYARHLDSLINFDPDLAIDAMAYKTVKMLEFMDVSIHKDPAPPGYKEHLQDLVRVKSRSWIRR